MKTIKELGVITRLVVLTLRRMCHGRMANATARIRLYADYAAGCDTDAAAWCRVSRGACVQSMHIV